MTEVNSQKKSEEWSPKIIAFLCNWCSYAGADLAGVSRIQYPPSIRVVRVPCSGRVNPFFIIKSLLDGWDGVLISGCHPGDCHYIQGNFYARRRIALVKKMLEFIGLEPERFQMSWVSAAEGTKYTQVIKDFVEEIKPLGPQTKLRRNL